jgi:hypothetical protein
MGLCGRRKTRQGAGTHVVWFCTDRHNCGGCLLLRDVACGRPGWFEDPHSPDRGAFERFAVAQRLVLLKEGRIGKEAVKSELANNGTVDGRATRSVVKDRWALETWR